MAAMLFDLHVHTDLSPCSCMAIEDIVAHAADCGLDGVCITDHDTVGVRHRIAEGFQENGLVVVFGMEYTTTQGDFLVFGPVEALPPHLPAELLLKAVHEQGGVAVAAHPFRSLRSADEALIRRGLCTAIESLNGRNTSRENAACIQWSRRYDLIQCAGSDAHTLGELGTYATRFAEPILTRGDLVAALKAGRCHPDVPTPVQGFAPGMALPQVAAL